MNKFLKESLILYSIDKDNMGVEVKLVKVISDNDSIQVELKAGLRRMICHL